MKHLTKATVIGLTLCALPAMGSPKIEKVKSASKTAALGAATIGSLAGLYRLAKPILRTGRIIKKML